VVGVLDLIKEAIKITKQERSTEHKRAYILRKQKEYDYLGNLRFHTTWESYRSRVKSMSATDVNYYYNKIRQKCKDKDDVDE